VIVLDHNIPQDQAAVSDYLPMVIGPSDGLVNTTAINELGDTVSVKVLETDRLVLRRLSIEDAVFVFELVNEPAFIQFIGDKGVRTLDDARDYILKGPVDSYERYGFGLYLCELKDTRASIGICGLIKRDCLDDVDIGFAFLPEFWGRGYCYEAASAVLATGKREFGLDRIVAVTSPDNERSIKVLEKLGMRFERMVRLADDASEVKLFGPGRVQVKADPPHD
jgi:RimJ/RimL family protein N-acetyltransferase